jgi:hypothetical protein
MPVGVRPTALGSATPHSLPITRSFGGFCSAFMIRCR